MELKEPVAALELIEKKKTTFTFSYPFGGFDPNFVDSLEALLLHELIKDKDANLLGGILKAGGPYVGMNRGRITAQFLQYSQDTHLVMVDTDIKFPSNILELFLYHLEINPEAHIIAGRVDLLNGLPVFYTFNEDRTRTHYAHPFQGLKEFDLVGTGIICISRICLEALYKKYNSVACFFHHEILPPENREMGDDFSFCLHAKELGFKIYGAWDIYGLHVKPQGVKSLYPELQQLVIQ